MAQSIPSDILPTLIKDSLKLRVEHLENVFKREETDLLTLHKHMTDIEKHVELFLTRTHDYIAKKEAQAAKKATEDSGRMNTEPSTSRSKLAKSIGKNEDKKGLTKTKTAAVLKTIKKPEEKTLNKAKSTANLSPDVSKSRPKTPKPAEKILTKSSTKADITSSAKKDLNKTHSVKNLQHSSKDDQKGLKRTPTGKPAPTDKTKSGLTKSNTKGDLLKKKEVHKNGITTTTTTINSAASEEKNSSSNNNEVHEKETQQGGNIIEPLHHPNRVENFSGLIGVVTDNNDVLLTKDETLQIADKNEIINSNQPRIDYNEILDDRWTNFAKYYNKKDHIVTMLINKTYGKLSVIQLIQEVQKEILENESKIKNLREKYSLDDLNKEIPPFALSRGAVKAVELLNEPMYFKVFTTDGNFPSDDVYIPYRILFTFAEMPELYTLKCNEEFWKKTCEYFVSSSEGKMGNLINSLLQRSEFKNETIYKVIKLVQPQMTKMTPNFYSKLCATTGLVIFLVKDSLEYAGVLQEKKTSQSRIYKNLMYTFEVLQNKMERLKGIQSRHFN